MGTLKMCVIGIGVAFLLAVSVWQQFTLSQQHTEMMNLRANLRANNEQSVAGSFDSPADAGTTVSCPGGSQLACMDLCLASVFQSCVQSCANRCSTEPPPTPAAVSAEVDPGAVQATIVQVGIVDPDESAGSTPDKTTEEEAGGSPGRKSSGSKGSTGGARGIQDNNCRTNHCTTNDSSTNYSSTNHSSTNDCKSKKEAGGR